VCNQYVQRPLRILRSPCPAAWQAGGHQEGRLQHSLLNKCHVHMSTIMNMSFLYFVTYVVDVGFI
jgi:hypothetical protein